MTNLSTSGMDMVLLHAKQIGPIEVHASISETHIDQLEITSHPVDGGAGGPGMINDHAFKKPREVTMVCGWSNADLRALAGGTAVAVANGAAVGSDYAAAVYTRLLALQESREPFDLITSRRKYNNMLIQSLSVTDDGSMLGGLKVTVKLTEVVIVKAREAFLPPLSRQADPKKTGSPSQGGSRSAKPANPRSP